MFRISIRSKSTRKRESLFPRRDHVQHSRRGDPAHYLRHNVGNQVRSRKPLAHNQSQRNSRVQMGARNMTERVNHHHHRQAERQRNPQKSDTQPRKRRRNYRASTTSQNQPECSEEFCRSTFSQWHCHCTPPQLQIRPAFQRHRFARTTLPGPLAKLTGLSAWQRGFGPDSGHEGRRLCGAQFPTAFGKFQCCHTLTSRNKKQKVPPSTAACIAESRSFLPITSNAAPASAAVAYTSARSTKGTRASKMSRSVPPPTAVTPPSRIAMNGCTLNSSAFSVPATAKSASAAASSTNIAGPGIAST